MTGTCVPNCVNKCGQPDGCGNLCESCKTAKTYYCQDSQHIQECTPVLGIPVCYPYKTCTAPQTCIAGQAVCSGECIPSIACSVATCGKTISDGCTNIQCPACGGNGTLSFMDTCGQCGGTSLVTYKNETCGPGLICACPGPGTAKCYDSVKNKAFIACSLAGGFPLGAKGSCKKDICTAYGGWIPQSYGSASASITGDFGYILAQDCFDCLPGGLRAMPTDPSSACCSGQFAAGSTLCLAPISAYNFSHVQVTSTPSIESLPLSSVTGSTPETLLKHACISNDDCAESNCKSFDWLVDNKYTTEKDKNNFFDTYAGPAATITGGITGLGLGSIAGFAAGQSLAVGACAIAERIGIAGGPETAVISVGVCRLIVEAPFVLAGGTTGVFVGGTVGDRAVSFFNEIADRHTNIVGVCIPPGDTGGGVCSYFDWLKPVLTPLGAADKSCTVGFIIAFVILLILLRSFAR